jgi:hypothetical protein
MKRVFVLALIALLAIALPASAQRHHCESVAGAIMTNFNLLPYGPEGGTNLGPAFGDLEGSVAATTISLSPFTFQHYWVATNGDVINFKPAVLKPTLINDHVIAAQWGDYRAEISGGTGRFAGATGYIEAFGLVDLQAGSVVLRYRGEVCYVDMTPRAKK